MASKHSRSSLIILVILLVLFAALPAGRQAFPTSLNSSVLNFVGILMNKNLSNSISTKKPLFQLTDNEAKWVEDKLNTMSTYEKCAQMVMPWVTGEYSAADSKEFKRLKHLVEDVKVGGLIFFKGNILNEAMLINKMQSLADVPLLISSDFERGLGMRLTDGLDFPYNMALAATGDIHLAYEMAKIVSVESRSLGVHQNYAPVSDVNNNPLNPIINIRSYSEDKEIVSRFTSAFINGESEERVISTAKHFPGHGNTEIDSHTDMPKISVDQYNLANIELAPFAAAINSGVKSIMIGHLSVPALDPSGVPATLSKRIVTNLLKEEMGFKGLVVTDAMNMSAITKYYSVAEATVKAIKAGNDIVLMPPDEEIAVNSIYEAVENNEISIERINESVKKILTAKEWLHIRENKYSNVEDLNNIIGISPHKKLAKDIAVKSITLVKNDDKIIPIDPATINRVACISISESNDNESNKIFESQLENKFRNVQKIFLTKKSKKRDFRRAFNIAKNSNLILLPSYVRVKAYEGTVSLSETNTEFINKILDLETPSVVISFGNPYLLSLFPKAATYLCAYGDVPVSQEAMAEAILGENKIQGRLPITIPNTKYVIGDGIKVESSTLKYVEGGEDLNYNFATIDAAMKQAIDNKIFPGAVLLIGKERKVIYEKAFGNFTYEKSSTLMSKDALFDLGSVSQSIGTISAAMLLCDEEKLDLNKKVSDYLPEFANNGKEKIKIQNLLEHNSGLIDGEDFFTIHKEKEDLLNAIMNEKPSYEIGSKNEYCEMNMIILQQVIEKITGNDLSELLSSRLFKPLKMNRTMYNPPRELYYYCPPTSDNFTSVKRNKGVAFDRNTFVLGGVSGSAGVFSTADDLAIFMQMMLQEGSYGDQEYFKSSTVKKWTEVQSIISPFGLGWETNLNKTSSAGGLFSENSFGQSSLTGTSIWADKDKNIFVILLTNSIYPEANNNEIVKFRPELHSKIIQTISENL